MPLAPGTRVGVYEIVAPVGAGGMGEAYRARDVKLNRDVAIKVLPDLFVADPDRIARFEREARTLAALSHPGIAAIFGFEESSSSASSPTAIRALVMEFVDGPTLADRLAQGPLSVEEALSVARQTADALSAAHEQGIIHRDLKPANVKVRPDGTVKILDFGLAKAIAPDTGADVSAAVANSPTLTRPVGMTGVGVILGTAAYMAPEQAKGHQVTKAADLWAFGCVLYEMLAGRPVFQGDDVTEILAAVVRAEPDWSALPPSTPPAIHTLLRRCLRKDRRQRLQDATDARLDIEDVLSAPAAVAPRPATRAGGGRVALVAVVAAAVAGFATWRFQPREPSSNGISRSLIGVSPAEQVPADTATSVGRPQRPTIAVSPDGRLLVFSGRRDGISQLYLRSMDRLEATPIAGTTNASAPFFSPDGKWVGFWQGQTTTGDGELKKLPVSGGPAVLVCRTTRPTGMTWDTNDHIIFSRGSDLWKVPASGGTPELFMDSDAAKGEISFKLPHALPDGGLLLTIQRAPNVGDDARIGVRLDDNTYKVVVERAAADARYVPSGHLVFARLGVMVAVPFDLARHEVTGPEVALIEDVMQDVNSPDSSGNSGSMQFAMSATGTLVYLNGGIFPDAEGFPVWVDRSGKVTPIPIPPPRSLRAPRLSPDGHRVALHTLGMNQRMYLYDVEKDLLTQFPDGRASHAVWGRHDGRERLTFAGIASGVRNIFWTPADGSGGPERLTTSTLNQAPSSWSPDGRTLAFTQGDDIWLLTMDDAKGSAGPFFEAESTEQSPMFSPDGRWIAYTSDRSGRHEVYVRPFPGPGTPYQVSRNGGREPTWSTKGELFFVEAIGDGIRQMMAVDVQLQPAFSAALPRALFKGRYSPITLTRGYDVMPDGSRFVMVELRDQYAAPRPITHLVLVQNWFEELKARVPSR